MRNKGKDEEKQVLGLEQVGMVEVKAEVLGKEVVSKMYLL